MMFQICWDANAIFKPEDPMLHFAKRSTSVCDFEIEYKILKVFQVFK